VIVDAITVYRPGGRSGIVNVPSAVDLTSRRCPVSTFSAVISVSGMAAALPSTTWPARVAVADWACAAVAELAQRMTSQRISLRENMTAPSNHASGSTPGTLSTPKHRELSNSRMPGCGRTWEPALDPIRTV